MIALLLNTYEPCVPPIQWQQWQYLEVAEQLGQLHATNWQNTEQLSQFPWLRRYRWILSRRHVQHAAQQWRRLMVDARFQPLIPSSRYKWLMGYFSLLEGVESLLADFPLTMCHGDCHIDNFLRDEQGQLVWADWQEVGVGPGPADVSFFWQRAFKAGGAVPFEAMTTSYHRSLEAETGKQISFVHLRRMLGALELWSWLLIWPDYLMMDASPQWLPLLFERIDLLANRFHLRIYQE
ncbi:hypothetical protein KDH_06560 [Dictyobacter sp. S3.2.2.5]|uniref:Aminoglycoside phosphotransferase domain-containing protein n=1 Tax=Dictyobacter halimunensis TaxID=3026934 RepID=A0ABQ6FMZ1_9CHLR|nr:hypothetical protein KDH_06560 [Dictyobacter sp. S3.2.2.5]